MSIVEQLRNQTLFDPDLPSYHHTIHPPDLSKMPWFANQFAYIIDASTSKFSYASDNLSSITGYHLEALTIEFWYTIIHPEDLPIVTRIGEALYRIGWQVLPTRKEFDFKPWDVYAYAEYRIKKRMVGTFELGDKLLFLQKIVWAFQCIPLG